MSGTLVQKAGSDERNEVLEFLRREARRVDERRIEPGEDRFDRSSPVREVLIHACANRIVAQRRLDRVEMMKTASSRRVNAPL